ncbi:hypothetical protein JW935_11275 [candidate division KSB1 bacterium]|nr:hypothetical protein [candidate division KSB1 bacterium]
MKKNENILLIGDIQCGKSTIVRSVLRTLTGYKGLFSCPVFEKKRVTGFQLKDQTNGSLGIFAHVEFSGKPHFDKYGIDLDVFNDRAEKFLRTVPPSTNLLVIDEIGIIEESAEKYQTALENVFNGPIPVFAVVQSRALYFLEKVETFKSIRMYHTDDTHREIIAEEIRRIFQK